MFDVVTFGSAVVDVFVDTDVAERNGMISYPVGSKILLKHVTFDVGGGGTNTAVAFSRLGLKTGYVGKLGSDASGDSILKLLKKERVSFLGERDKRAITGYSVILDSKKHNRTILTYKGASDSVKFSELNLRKLQTKWLYLTSLLGESFKTQKKLVDALTRRNTKIAFNPSEYQIKALSLGPILRLTEVLVLNREEGELLRRKYHAKGKTLLHALHSLGPRVVVVTDKNRLVQAFDGMKVYSIVPHKVKVIERTGAGDAFASGFVAGLIVGKSIDECLELGLTEGESVLRYFGAKNNLLRRDLKKEVK